jgi:probable regulatory domain-containing protein
MEVINNAEKIDYDAMAKRVFEKGIEIVGGIRKLVEYRNLTWLPSLAEAAYVIVLSNETTKTTKEIAEYVGITEQTVKQILRADPEAVKKYLEGEIEKVDYHKAGGIAKLAYEEVKNESGIFISEKEMESLGVEWAIKVLERIRGIKFPADKQLIYERLKNVAIKGIPFKKIVEKLPDTIKTSAELLHLIKSATETQSA